MLTAVDKQILNLLQGNLPIVARPFALLAEQLGIDENIVLERLRVLKSAGYIRRIGPFFDSECIGYIGTLVALSVDIEQLGTVAVRVNEYIGVTHNYEREGMFNLWFTLITADHSRQQKILTEVAALPGVRRLMNLPATRKYKVSVQFALE